MFSPSRLDPGTRLLLEAAPQPPAAGNLLDLGCGYGPLALVLAVRSPGAQVWGVDVNRRALELCARNAERAGLTNVRCARPDDPAVPDEFPLIWSKPPSGGTPGHAGPPGVRVASSRSGASRARAPPRPPPRPPG